MSIKSRFYDAFLALGERRGMAARRAELLAGAGGRVLEIGAGTGLNLPHYRSDLDALVLLEPDTSLADGLYKRAAQAAVEAEVVIARAEALPFADDSFDTVVTTMVLCTVPDVTAALGEIRRVLRPGGRLLFIEHVLDENRGRPAWQRRLAGAWAAFADGCRCDRETLAALRAAGLDVRLAGEAEWSGMPFLVRPLVVGEALA